MPPALGLSLALIGALFSAALVGLSYARWNMTQPLDGGFFALQRDLAGEADLDGWAKMQRSKAFRLASMVLSILVFVLCLCGIAYFGYLTFVGAAVLN